jgi:hypothetical protein
VGRLAFTPPDRERKANPKTERRLHYRSATTIDPLNNHRRAIASNKISDLHDLMVIKVETLVLSQIEFAYAPSLRIASSGQ